MLSMLPPLDADTLTWALVGGAGGVAFALGSYLVRDWQYVLRKWRARRAAEWLPEEEEDDSEYRAFPVTEEERRKLPVVTAWMGFVGAAGLAGFMQQSEIFMLVLMAVVSGVAILRAIVADGAATIEVGADEGERAGLDWRERMKRIGNELAVLATLGMSMLMLPEADGLRDRIDLSQGTIATTMMLVALAIPGWIAVERWRQEGEDMGEYVSSFDGGLNDIQRTLAALAGVLFMIAVIMMLS